MVDEHDGTRELKWLFRGTMVVPTGNPLAADPTVQQLGDDPHCQWLGPGLKLLLDHILTVDCTGIVRHLEPSASFLVQRQLTSMVAAKSMATNVEILLPHEVLCPGMIDLHIHAPQYAYTGTATDRPLMGADGWLETYTFPAERRLRDDLTLAKNVYDGVVSATLRNGTTTAVYFATLDVEPCKLLVDCAIQKGQRALIGKVCMDRNSPEDYCQSLEQNLQETEMLIDYIYSRAGKRKRHDNDGKTAILPLVLPLVTPRFIPTCTPELLSALGEIASRHSCHITSHISESIDEVAFSRFLDANVDFCDGGGGRTDAAIFDSHKLLTDECIMAHGVHLSDADCDLMKERGSAVAHCPLSNFFFAGGVLPCRHMLQRCNLVGLGTDVAGGYNPSMLHSSRMVVVASQALQQQQQQQDPQATGTMTETALLDYRQAFYLATMGGAEALGLQNRIGSLAGGMEFDAVLLSADVKSSPVQIFDSDSVSDVFQKLCVLGDDRNVKRVFVQGNDVTIQ